MSRTRCVLARAGRRSLHFDRYRGFFLSRRFDQAVPKLLLAIQEDYPSTYRVLAARYAHLGPPDEVRGIIKRLRAIVPVLVPDVSFLRNPKQRELYLSGVRLAMGDPA